MKSHNLILLTFLGMVVTSTLGIHLIEGHGESPFSSLFNSLWWTMVTVSTVGYGDMYPATLAGKLFGILVIISGVLFNSLIISMAANWFFAFRTSKEAGLKAIKTSDHIVVCSDSPVFIHSVLTENQSYVDRDLAIIVTPLERHPLLGSQFEKVPWVQGHAYRKEVLKKASASAAKVGYVAYNDDADAVMTVMQLEVGSPGGVIKTMAQFKHQDYRSHLINVGCDFAIKTYDVYVPLMVLSCTAQGAPVWVRAIILQLTNRAPTLKAMLLEDSYVGKTWLAFCQAAKAQLGELPLGFIGEEGIKVNPPDDFILPAHLPLLSITPSQAGTLGDLEQDAISILGFEEIPKEGHMVICSDEAAFIERLLQELMDAKITGELIILSDLAPLPCAAKRPDTTWVRASSFSDDGLAKAKADKARIAFIDHQRDSHTLMSVLRLEKLTNGSVFSIASYREPGFDKRLIGVGCDYCINVDELIAPILSQNALHHGIGDLIEQVIRQHGDDDCLQMVILTENFIPQTWLETMEWIKGRFGHLAVTLIKGNSNKMLVNPHPDVQVTPGDRLLVITHHSIEFDSTYFRVHRI